MSFGGLPRRDIAIGGRGGGFGRGARGFGGDGGFGAGRESTGGFGGGFGDQESENGMSGGFGRRNAIAQTSAGFGGRQSSGGFVGGFGARRESTGRGFGAGNGRQESTGGFGEGFGARRNDFYDDRRQSASGGFGGTRRVAQNSVGFGRRSSGGFGGGVGSLRTTGGFGSALNSGGFGAARTADGLRPQDYDIDYPDDESEITVVDRANRTSGFPDCPRAVETRPLPPTGIRSSTVPAESAPAVPAVSPPIGTENQPLGGDATSRLERILKLYEDEFLKESNRRITELTDLVQQLTTENDQSIGNRRLSCQICSITVHFELILI